MFDNQDLYGSQANLQANSFYGPQNQAQMGNGWGMDPNLLTPSYDAPYRPQWNGNGPPSDFSKRGFFAGANNLMPWQNYGNTSPLDNWHNSVNSVVDTPAATAAFVVQRIAAPALAFGMANKALGPSSFMGAFRGQGVGASMGQNLFRGAGTGIGRGVGMNAAWAGRMGAGMGVAGSALGAFAVPFAAAQSAMWGAEKALFNPFLNNVASAESLHQNFKGVSFGEGGGNTVTGRGFGYREASGMASQITQQGIKDKMFGTDEYKNLADLTMRSGLLDNTKAADITKSIKNISEQVKLIMSISKDPSVQGAIESLSKLSLGGASTHGAFSGASHAYAQMGMAASMAGTTVQRMMDTTGAQGQYLYGSNGMTPYLGQLAAANSKAAFVSANRVGLISEGQMARMGGIEGATQSSLTGQVNYSQTLFNKMRMYNSYLGSGSQNGTVGNVSAFGQSMTSDPMGTYGASMLLGGAMSSRQSAERGNLATQDQLMASLEGVPGVKNPDGSINAEKAVPYLMRGGMSIDQIQAWYHERMASEDKGAYKQRLASMRSQHVEQWSQFTKQNDLEGGFTGAVWNPLAKAGRTITSSIADAVVSPMTESMGSAKDSVFGAAHWLSYGDSMDGEVTMDSAEGRRLIGGGAPAGAKTLAFNNLQDDALAIHQGNAGVRKMKSVISDLKTRAAGGDAKAQAAIDAVVSGKTTGANKELIHDQLKLSSSEVGRGKDFSTSDFAAMEGYFSSMKEDTSSSSSDSNSKDLVGMTEDITGISNKIPGLENWTVQDNLDLMSKASRLKARGLTAENYSKFEGDKDYQALAKYFPKGSHESVGIAISQMGEKTNNAGLTSFAAGNATSAKDLDKDLLTKYNAAKPGEAQRAILLEQTARNSGGIIGHKVGPGADDAAHIAASGLALSEGQMQKKLHSEYSSGRIKFDTYQSSLSSLEFKGAVDVFRDAVNVLADRAGVPKAGPAGSNEQTSRVSSDTPKSAAGVGMWDYFANGKRK